MHPLELLHAAPCSRVGSRRDALSVPLPKWRGWAGGSIPELLMNRHVRCAQPMCHPSVSNNLSSMFSYVASTPRWMIIRAEYRQCLHINALQSFVTSPSMSHHLALERSTSDTELELLRQSQFRILSFLSALLWNRNIDGTTF